MIDVPGDANVRIHLRRLRCDGSSFNPMLASRRRPRSKASFAQRPRLQFFTRYFLHHARNALESPFSEIGLNTYSAAKWSGSTADH